MDRFYLAKRLISLARLALGANPENLVIHEKRMHLDISLPEGVSTIHKAFAKHGKKLYLVGGAVRDAVLGKTPKDFDLATDALPDQVERILDSAGIRNIPTGKAFGVITAVLKDGDYEIATFREDIGSGRRPEAVKFTDIATDVQRRDLTINALFYDLDTKEVVDLVGGLEDLKNKVVRTVGSPQERFGEDRLRVLRALRFAGRFGSDLDPRVDEALKEDSSLSGVSPERIRDEFLKGIKSAKSSVHFLKMVDRYSLFAWIFPDLNVDKDFIESNDPHVVISTLLKNNSLDVLSKSLNKLKYTDSDIKLIGFLTALLRLTPDTVYLLKKMQKNSNAKIEQIKEFSNSVGLDSHLIDAFLRFDLSIRGADVMKDSSMKTGKDLGDEIKRLEIEKFKDMLGR